MLKCNMKDRLFQAIKEIVDVVTTMWKNLKFEDFQSMFLNWMEYLDLFIEHEGEYSNKSH
jgi:hypothetical protein